MTTTTNRKATQKAQAPAGVNRAAAERALGRLELDPADDPLAALVVTLADVLDAGVGAQTANVAREYRVALDRLRELHPGITPPDEYDRLMADLGINGAGGV